MEDHKEAKSIIEKLKKEGYIAYFAGGWVRDFLLEFPSDDIDIATDAPPDVIQNLFPKTVPIGIAFGIVLVLVGTKQFEVATFRSDLVYEDGRRPKKIAFTSAEEDAKRRDFTINGMFYDPLERKVIDFVEGKRDLEKKIVRAIGNPHERFREDRLRMIRAVRMACRFQFSIDLETEKAIQAHSKELFPSVAIERVVQEFTKMTIFPGFKDAVVKLYDLGLLQVIFPDLSTLTQIEIKERVRHLDDFPHHAPLVAYLFALFEGASEKKIEDLCKYLKLSNEEVSFALYLFYTQNLLQKENTQRLEWAYFYANDFANTCLGVLAARLPIEKRSAFVHWHEENIKTLHPFIERIQKRKPVVTSSHLIEKGIKPGKQMGHLLREAERISVNENLVDPQKVIEKLFLHS